MKRLLSWLLVLTMLVACLPMSVIPALAVETDVDTSEGSDLELPFDHLLPGYSADNRLNVEWTWNEDNTEATAKVTVPAGKTMYFEYKGDPAYELTIDDVKCEFTPAADRFDTNKFEITNDGAEAKTYALKVALPVGTYNNPVVIEKLSWYMDTVTQAAGDLEGYYYIYTAPAAGVVTLYISNVPEVVVQEPEYDEDGWEITPAVTEKYEGDIKVTKNGVTQYVLSVDGVDNYGLELQIPVAAGDQLLINTILAADNNDNAYPAGEYSWMGNFAYPAGSEQNPIIIEWSWNDDYSTATATVEVEADGTYYVGQAGMILTANGEEIEQDATGTFVLNAGPYELKLETPVGAQGNPEVIDVMPYEDSNSLDADANYNYVWTATEDGTVTLDITDGANITVNKVIEISEDGWPVTEQFELATVEYDDNGDRSWVVAENLVIEVVAGQQLNIQVNGLTDWDTWSAPAVDYTLTASFEAAEPEYTPYEITVSGITLDMASELFISGKFLVKELKDDSDAVLSIDFNGSTTEYNLKEYIDENGLDSRGRLLVKMPIPSPYMDKKVTVSIVDGAGHEVIFVDSAFGGRYEGSFSFGIETYMDQIWSVAGTQFDTTKDAVVALLTYGSYAQTYFTAKGLPNISSEPVYNLLTKFGREPIDVSAFDPSVITQEITHSGDAVGVTMRGGTPALDAAIYMVVQMNYDKAYALEDYTFTLEYYEQASKTTHTLPLEATLNNKGRIEVKIENIAAALFDCEYEVHVTNNVTGETYVGTFSVYIYLKAAIDIATLPGEADLYRAMYYYNQAANALFEK